MKKSEISLLLGFVFTVAVSLFSHQIYDAHQIRENTLRLHIIANSNGEYDQKLKLGVRDIILENEAVLPVKAESFDNAMQITTENLEEIENCVQRFLKENNAPYSAKCSLENFYFDTTQYDSFALPEGEYTALTVRLGKAEGQNWWCVMYPALCSQTCGEVMLENSSDYIKTKKITARFKIVEIYEEIKAKLTDRNLKKYENLSR